MNVDPTGPVRAPQAGRRSDRGGGARSADFSRHLDFTEGGTSVSGARPAAAVDVMFAGQQVEGDADDDSNAKRRGHSMLEMLEELRRDMLTGVVDRSHLNRLSALVTEQSGAAVDPRLRGVLDEIELRAAVELAKLERADAEGAR